jgi:hypothetical protein
MLKLKKPVNFLGTCSSEALIYTGDFRHTHPKTYSVVPCRASIVVGSGRRPALFSRKVFTDVPARGGQNRPTSITKSMILK